MAVTTATDLTRIDVAPVTEDRSQDTRAKAWVVTSRNVKRAKRRREEFAQYLTPSQLTARICQARAGHLYNEHLQGADTLTRVYLDYDAYEDPTQCDTQPKMMSQYRGRLAEVIARANIVRDHLLGASPDVYYLLACREPGTDPKHDGKVKFSFRVFFQGVAIPYSKIPTLLAEAGQEDDGFWDTSVYKPGEQLLACVYGAKANDDGRTLRPITTNGNRFKAPQDPLMYTAQAIDPMWPVIHALTSYPVPEADMSPSSIIATPR